MSQTLPLTIAICTYNRSAQLSTTLACLRQCHDSFQAGDELLVIDNNSSDDTRQVVEQCQQACENMALAVHYIFEKTQGLSAARNRALREFKNEVIVFFDDDISIFSDTIECYRQGVLRHPDYDAFGGRILVAWGEHQPSWYRDDSLPLINGLIGHYNLGDNNHSYQITDLLPYGANFALRRRLIDQIGDFDESLGVKGGQIGRGEESNYFERAMALNYQVLYLADVRVYHRFQVERLTVSYLYRYGIEKGRAQIKHLHMPHRYWLLKSCVYAFKGVFQLLKNRQDRFYQCVINIGIQRGLALGADQPSREVA